MPHTQFSIPGIVCVSFRIRQWNKRQLIIGKVRELVEMGKKAIIFSPYTKVSHKYDLYMGAAVAIGSEFQSKFHN